jgi:hypothetical protein
VTSLQRNLLHLQNALCPLAAHAQRIQRFKEIENNTALQVLADDQADAMRAQNIYNHCCPCPAIGKNVKGAAIGLPLCRAKHVEALIGLEAQMLMPRT